MYTVFIYHNVWGEDQLNTCEAETLEDVPRIITEHILYLQDDCGYEVEIDDLDYYIGFDIQITKKVEHDQDAIYEDVKNLLVKAFDERREENKRLQLENEKRQFERLKKKFDK